VSDIKIWIGWSDLQELVSEGQTRQQLGYKFMARTDPRPVVVVASPEDEEYMRDLLDARAIMGLGPWTRVILRMELEPSF
jgi:hypothetical protein